MPALSPNSFRRFACSLVAALGAACFMTPSFAAEETAEASPYDWEKERQFWAFRAPQTQERPSVENGIWPTQPLDFFVLAALEKKKLAPSKEASKQTLVRRLTYDLTGLPPTPEEVEAFVSDRSADAYRRLVERLLNSPGFGERMASLWLPLARYAEDQAHQVGDDTKYFYPNAFKYREWVINAFNHDLPYDQFIRYQLAADKFEAADHLAGLGFLGLGPKYYNRGRVEVMADEWEDRVDTVSRTMLGLTVACARCHDHKFEPITMADYYGMAGVFASTKMVNKKSGGEAEGKDVSADKMDASTLHMVEDGEPKDLRIFIRGNPEREGELAERRFLQVLSDVAPGKFSEGSGRKELAEAIASRSNPLTARVFVNRIWGAMFGQPLVATPSNFGHSGQMPSHPELLDDLAARFMESGWSVKTLVREMALSSTYRQSSTGTGGEQADAANQLLWRMNRKRLSVEQWRDAALLVSGGLKAEGGKSLELDDPQNLRRTVYARVSRLKLNDFFMQFDYPDANVHAEKRASTTTPMQKLFLLNNPFVLARADELVERLGQISSDNAAKITAAYRLLYGRAPEAAELQLGIQFVHAGQEGRWSDYAQMLLASNEMMYVD